VSPIIGCVLTCLGKFLGAVIIMGVGLPMGTGFHKNEKLDCQSEPNG
jgi:hypothetical protein